MKDRMLWIAGLCALMLSSAFGFDAVRVKAEHHEGCVTITQYGSGGPLDCAEFGLLEHKYILTAAHVVSNRDVNIFAEIETVPAYKIMESVSGAVIERPARLEWRSCSIVSIDTKHDVAVLRVNGCLKNVVPLQADSQLVIVGSPESRPVTAQMSSGYEHALVAVSGMKHGMSGSPVYDSQSKCIAGIVLAGIAEESHGQMRDDIAFVLSAYEIRKSLKANIKPERSDAAEHMKDLLNEPGISERSELDRKWWKKDQKREISPDLIPADAVIVTAPQSDTVTFVAKIAHLFLTIFGSVLILIASFAVHKVATKYHLDTIVGSHELLDTAIEAGIHRAEKFGEDWADAHGAKPLASEKLNVALNTVESVVTTPIFQQFAKDHVVNLIEAKLHALENPAPVADTNIIHVSADAPAAPAPELK